MPKSGVIGTLSFSSFAKVCTSLQDQFYWLQLHFVFDQSLQRHRFVVGGIAMLHQKNKLTGERLFRQLLVIQEKNCVKLRTLVMLHCAKVWCSALEKRDENPFD